MKNTTLFPIYRVAAVVVVLSTIKGAFLIAQDWGKVLPSTPKAKPRPKAGIEEVEGDIETVSPVPKIPRGDGLSKVAALGKKLFFDTNLSANGKVSCGTCHLPERGYTSGGLPPRLQGGKLARRAPTIVNVAYGRSFFWDGRASTLEEQAVGPLTNPDEMGEQSLNDIVRRLDGLGYARIFQEAYADGGPVTSMRMIRAITEFERTIQNVDGPFDLYLRGPGNLPLEARRGFDLFRGKAHCYKCHDSKVFTDHKFHNTGMIDRDAGRMKITLKPEDFRAFKTPTLRGVKDCAPYMHDGSIKTLEDVVEFYNKGGARPGNLTVDKEIKPLNLTPREKRDLVEFLKVL